jgi:OOP family OmpA-OmpF porin
MSINKPALFLALAIAANTAHADDRIRIGGFAGAHLFSDKLELGAFDTPDADTPRNSLSFGVRVGYALIPELKVEGELAINPTRTRENKSDVTVFAWRASAVYGFNADFGLRPFVLAGVGALTSSPVDREILDEDTDFAPHAGLGLEYAASDDWGVRFDARSVFAPTTDGKFLTTDFEFFVGLYKAFPNRPPPVAPDADKDGVFDADDKCPEVAEDQDGFEDEDGCPDEDNDQDGVPDATDNCPVEKETMNGIDDADGCPEPDGDGDGVLGSQDKCPNEPEDKDGFQDEDGCLDVDNDGDGIPDAADQCPLEKGDQTNSGCPPKTDGATPTEGTPPAAQPPSEAAPPAETKRPLPTPKAP